MSQNAEFQKIPNTGYIIKVYLSKKTIVAAQAFGTKTHTFGRVRELMAANGANTQNQLPAMIVAVWGDQPTSAVNLRIYIDGPDGTLWKTSVACGTANEAGVFPEGSWNWPVIQFSFEKRFTNHADQ